MKKMYQNYLEKLLSKGYVLLDYSNENLMSDKDCASIFTALNNSFNSLGYEIDIKNSFLIKKASFMEINAFYELTYQLLLKSKGDGVKHTIFYKNFPNMDKINSEEYELRALLHYLTASEESMGFMNEDILDEERCEIHNQNKQILRIINTDQADKLIVQTAKMMFEGKMAISSCEHDFLRNVFLDYPQQINPQEIPFKENMGLYISLLVENKDMKDVLTISSLKSIKTFTDFLRVYASLSKASPTLKRKVNFISLSRCVRTTFLSILEEIVDKTDCFDELKKHEFLFKRAFEKLHVGDYAKEYPNVYRVVNNFRKGNFLTFNGELNLLLDKPKEYLEMPSAKPGEYARKMDFLLRNECFDNALVFYYFNQIKSRISSNVLIQLWEFFVNRKKEDERIFCLKGQYANAYYSCEDHREEIDEQTKNKAIASIEKELSRRYRNKQQIDNVFLDEEMKNYMVPNSMRNKSASINVLTFGTKIKLDLEEGNFLRIFTHWKNNKSRTDIDLSLEFFSEDFKNSCSLAWHNMTGGKEFFSFHSGDIVSAPKGASEFIDFDYVKASNYYRYVLLVNTVYTGQEFADIKECFSGVMMMKEICKRGKVFNPEFVKYKFDLTQKGISQNVIFMLDLKTMELIYIDSPLLNYCNIASENPSILKVLKDALKKKMSLYELIKLHKNHLTFVDDKSKASFIISNDENSNLKSTDVEEILLNWL